MKRGLLLAFVLFSAVSMAQTQRVEGRLDVAGKPIAQLAGDFVSFRQQNQFAIIRFDGKMIQKGIQSGNGLLTPAPLRIDYGIYFEKAPAGYIIKSVDGERLNEVVFTKFKPFRTSNTVAEITEGSVDKTYAYIDTSGHIFAQYDKERYYRIFGINLHEGYHNTDGYIAKSILFTDDNFRLYSEGRLALQHPETGLWGFVDSTMRLVIPAKFNDVAPFSEEKAAVRNANGLWGFIDKEGEMIISPRFSHPPSTFSSQRARVQNQEGKFGYIDRVGNVAIEPQYLFATKFYKGYALVRIDSRSPIRLIDQQGTVLAQFDAGYQYYDSASGKGMWNAKPDPFHTAETLIQLVDMGKGVFHNGKHYGIVSKTGEIVLPFEYSYIKDYESGRLLGFRSSFVGGKLKNEYYLMNDKGEAYIQFVDSGF